MFTWRGRGGGIFGEKQLDFVAKLSQSWIMSQSKLIIQSSKFLSRSTLFFYSFFALFVPISFVSYHRSVTLLLFINLRDIGWWSFFSRLLFFYWLDIPTAGGSRFLHHSVFDWFHPTSCRRDSVVSGEEGGQSNPDEYIGEIKKKKKKGRNLRVCV